MLHLCSLFCSKISSHPSYFHRTVAQFLESEIMPSVDIFEGCIWQEPLLSEEVVIQNWKSLLAVNLLCRLSGAYRSELGAAVKLFERHPWNESSQFFRSLVSLNYALADLPIPEAGPHLLESGAALIDIHEYCPWLALPYSPQHLSFGIYLCILAVLTHRQDLKEIVLRLAHWQLNTLDACAKPFSGLFVQEKDAKKVEQLCINYLLFRGTALLSEETPFGAIADQIMKSIQEEMEEKNEWIDPLFPLIEKWFDQHVQLSSSPIELSEHIYDPSTALVGYRSTLQHVVCTLHGAHTGLGSIKHGDVEIVSYGPQYLPLDECRGFGIEGNALSDHGMRRSLIEWKRHSFSLKGFARLVDKPIATSANMGEFRGIWFEIVQEFTFPHFHLKAAVLGLDGAQDIVFSFFIKALHCNIRSRTLVPRTLERFEGEAETILLTGKEHSIELQALLFKGKMQVIPLPVGNNFWGADFLIAFSLHPDQRDFQWNMKNLNEFNLPGKNEFT